MVFQFHFSVIPGSFEGFICLQNCVKQLCNQSRIKMRTRHFLSPFFFDTATNSIMGFLKNICHFIGSNILGNQNNTTFFSFLKRINCATRESIYFYCLAPTCHPSCLLVFITHFLEKKFCQPEIFFKVFVMVYDQTNLTNLCFCCQNFIKFNSLNTHSILHKYTFHGLNGITNGLELFLWESVFNSLGG